MNTHYVMVDYENVQPVDLYLLNNGCFKVIVFVGENQSKVTFESAAAIHSLGSKAQYVKIRGNGPNALDFHIAFYIGYISRAEPDAHFNIISKDTGFDPLIEHAGAANANALCPCNTRVHRHTDIRQIPFIKSALLKEPGEDKKKPVHEEKTAAPSITDHLNLVLANFTGRSIGLPGRISTLTGTISALFKKQLPPAQVTALVQDMQRRNWIKLDGTKVIYTLPGPGQKKPVEKLHSLQDPNCAPAKKSVQSAV